MIRNTRSEEVFELERRSILFRRAGLLQTYISLGTTHAVAVGPLTKENREEYEQKFPL